MLRFLRFVVTGTVLSTLVSAIALQALTQETGDYDATCYLRIEGRSTQNLSQFCGKKTPKAGVANAPGRPTVQSSPSPSAAIDPDDAPDDDQPATTPAPRSSIPSTRFPSPAPVAQPSPVRPPASQRSTLPNVPLVPNQTPDSEDVLPVPIPPTKRQLPPTERKRMASKLKPSPQAKLPSLPPLPPEDDVQASRPRLPFKQSPFKQRPFVPTVPAPLAPSVEDGKPQTQIESKPQPSPLDTLLQELLHQKYLYLFWVIVLQVPLLKVAIDRRSRPNARSRIQPTHRRVAPLSRVLPSVDEGLPDRVPESPAEEVILSEARALENATQEAPFDLAHADNQIAQIKAILASAVHNRVSDIHLEPGTEGLRVRYRIDGILRNVTTLPLEVSRRTIVALKVMADMDISESRRPQDARISEQYTSESAANLDLDLRVSTLPCVGGEKAVIRLLPRQNPFTHMDALGFTEQALSLYKSWLQQPQGMIIFTGPTGSGKTSTLYTSLQAIATEHVNVVTVEDPVEYILPSITQTQVNEVAGMTFAAGLRAILRQDPDIIMVGEIRDGETAETAVRAALTGHLVLTTLHTNDAVGAIPRLRDIGPDPGLISDALLGVVAQRLVRCVCPHCAEPYTPTESDLQVLRIRLAEANPQSWRHGRGCSHCYQSGYVGREAIIELLHVDATIRQLIYDGSLSALTTYLNDSEFASFRKAAIAKVTSGITTIAEIRRVLPASKLANDV